jgi:hypothetical protein
MSTLGEQIDDISRDCPSDGRHKLSVQSTGLRGAVPKAARTQLDQAALDSLNNVRCRA